MLASVTVQCPWDAASHETLASAIRGVSGPVGGNLFWDLVAGEQDPSLEEGHLCLNITHDRQDQALLHSLDFEPGNLKMII